MKGLRLELGPKKTWSGHPGGNRPEAVWSQSNNNSLSRKLTTIHKPTQTHRWLAWTIYEPSEGDIFKSSGPRSNRDWIVVTPFSPSVWKPLSVFQLLLSLGQMHLHLHSAFLISDRYQISQRCMKWWSQQLVFSLCPPKLILPVQDRRAHFSNLHATLAGLVKLQLS